MVPSLSRRIFSTSRFHRLFCTLRSSSISTEELIAARKQSDQELIMRVDEYNNEIGAVTREQMRANNFMHRASYILIFDELDRLYVQKRVHTKDHCPSHFDVCTGGVVDANEQNKDNAIRELKEEMGIDLKDMNNDKLKFHGTFFHGTFFLSRFNQRFVSLSRHSKANKKPSLNQTMAHKLTKISKQFYATTRGRSNNDALNAMTMAKNLRIKYEMDQTVKPKQNDRMLGRSVMLRLPQTIRG